MLRTKFANHRVLFGTTLVVAAGAVSAAFVVVLSLLLALAFASFCAVVYAT